MTLPMQCSIQRDIPCQTDTNSTRASLAPSASFYSADYEPAMDPEIPRIAPLNVSRQKTSSFRHSRLPIFKSVRHMLHKPSPTNTTSVAIAKADDPGTASNLGKRKDSLGAYEVRRRYSPEPQTPGFEEHRSSSPISALEVDEIYPSSPPQLELFARSPSPVSPVSAHSDSTHDMQTSESKHRSNLPETPLPNIIKRKPVSQRQSISTVDNISPPPSRGGTQVSDFATHLRFDHTSHFSWTSYDPSVRCSTAGNQNIGDTPAQHKQAGSAPKSRFSWSTVNTQPMPLESPPASPRPLVPPVYRTPPVQSILSRHRPIQRLDRDQYTTPSRKSSFPASTTPLTSNGQTPLSAASKFTPSTRGATFSTPDTTPGSSHKTLPLPPDMLTPVSPLSRLEALDHAEADKIHQRQNLERAIWELSKVENASPMDVPFAEVRDAKKRLEEMRATLAEIRLEEREIGIAISRARRKEGEEEGLWVRRVTG